MALAPSLARAVRDPRALVSALALREARVPGPPKPRLLDRLREAARTRRYSRRTEKAYVAWVRRSIVFHGRRHPLEMGEPEVRNLGSIRRHRGSIHPGLFYPH